MKAVPTLLRTAVAALGFALSAASLVASLYTLVSKWLGTATTGWSASTGP